MVRFPFPSLTSHWFFVSLDGLKGLKENIRPEVILVKTKRCFVSWGSTAQAVFMLSIVFVMRFIPV